MAARRRRSAHAHTDDRPGAVLRAPGDAVQRVPPDPGAHRPRPYGRSRHLSVRPRRVAAGPARVPLPAAAVRAAGPDRAVGGEDPARHRAALDGLPARPRRRATTSSTRTRKARPSASCSAALFGRPHLYDMHSSLPQQLSNFAFSRSRLLEAVFSSSSASSSTRSRVVIVICPQLADTVKAIDPAIDPVLIENAPGVGRRRRSTGRGRAGFGRSSGSGRLDAARALHGDVRGLPGARPAVRGGARGSPRSGRTCGSCWPAASPDQVERARAQARRAGAGEVVIFAGERPAEEIPAFLDAADVLVSPRSTRHEHAAEDLPVPPRGPADRRDAAADAHAGARRRGGDPHRADAGGLRERHPAGRRGPAAAADIGRRARAPGGDEVQLRGVPRQDAAGVVRARPPAAPAPVAGSAA